nr:MAG TPA: hypothetical protein [Bacteriophage sp.]
MSSHTSFSLLYKTLFTATISLLRKIKNSP